ncbi:MAG: conserved membrane protein of unknown function [Nitrospira sp.]
MQPCPQCTQQNQDDSKYCYQCGANLSSIVEAQPAFSSPDGTPLTDLDLLRAFIGPHSDWYLEQFKKFGSAQAPQFALTWNWPAFLFISFLWFLYRKMYLYAMVYAIGPMVSTYLTGDVTVGIVWSIMAGATGNYVYYWHCREQIGEIKRRSGEDPAKRERAIREAGGVQPYVIWVGIAFYMLFLLVMFKMAQEELSDKDRHPAKPAQPAALIEA